jgi:hypothetical protein
MPHLNKRHRFPPDVIRFAVRLRLSHYWMTRPPNNKAQTAPVRWVHVTREHVLIEHFIFLSRAGIGLAMADEGELWIGDEVNW